MGRTLLTGDTDYYVLTTGSDSNTGTTNTAGGAWLTPQKAMNFISSTLDGGGFNVTVHCGSGTFNPLAPNGDVLEMKPCVGINALKFVGAGVGSTTWQSSVGWPVVRNQVDCSGTQCQFSGINFASPSKQGFLLQGPCNVVAPGDFTYTGASYAIRNEDPLASFNMTTGTWDYVSTGNPSDGMIYATNGSRVIITSSGGAIDGSAFTWGNGALYADYASLIVFSIGGLGGLSNNAPASGSKGTADFARVDSSGASLGTTGPTQTHNGIFT